MRRRPVCCTCPAGTGQPLLFHAPRPPQLSKAILDGRPPGDLTGEKLLKHSRSAACLARSSGSCSALLEPDPNLKNLPIYCALSPTPRPAAPRYWNMARQRYCRRLPRYRNTLRVSADPVAKPAAQTRAESRVLDLRKLLRERDRLSAGGSRIRTIGTASHDQGFRTGSCRLCLIPRRPKYGANESRHREDAGRLPRDR